jgi:hypothetical protein
VAVAATAAALPPPVAIDIHASVLYWLASGSQAGLCDPPGSANQSVYCIS